MLGAFLFFPFPFLSWESPPSIPCHLCSSSTSSAFVLVGFGLLVLAFGWPAFRLVASFLPLLRLADCKVDCSCHLTPANHTSVRPGLGISALPQCMPCDLCLSHGLLILLHRLAQRVFSLSFHLFFFFPFSLARLRTTHPSQSDAGTQHPVHAYWGIRRGVINSVAYLFIDLCGVVLNCRATIHSRRYRHITSRFKHAKYNQLQLRGLMSEVSQSAMPSLGHHREGGSLRTALPSRPMSSKHRDPTTDRSPYHHDNRARPRNDDSTSPRSRASLTDEDVSSSRGPSPSSSAGDTSTKSKSGGGTAGQGGQICRFVLSSENT